MQEAVQELEAEKKLDARDLISGFLDLCDTRIKGIGTRATYIEAIFSTAFDRIPSKDNPKPKNPLKVETIEDMERLVKMFATLMKEEQNFAKLALVLVGEPDSHTRVSGDGISFNFGDKITEDDI